MADEIKEAQIEEITLAVADELTTELGYDVKTVTQHKLDGTAMSEEATRSLGINEAMSVGGFLITAMSFVWQLYKDRKNEADLMYQLASAVDSVGQLTDNNLSLDGRLKVIGIILSRLCPEITEDIAQEKTRSLQNGKKRTKEEWLRDWMGMNPEETVTRKYMTATILMPFAGMMDFAVYNKKGIHWKPSTGASSDLPDLVSVPHGFVTDLASIPRYFWWFVPPMGKYGHAAILHDWLYAQQSGDRKQADDVFYEAMMELGVEPALGKTMWAAVRLFGGSFWEAAAKEKELGAPYILKRFPDSPKYSWEEWKQQPDVLV